MLSLEVSFAVNFGFYTMRFEPGDSENVKLLKSSSISVNDVDGDNHDSFKRYYHRICCGFEMGINFVAALLV